MSNDEKQYNGELLPAYAIERAPIETSRRSRPSARAVWGTVAVATLLGFARITSFHLPSLQPCHVAPVPRGPIDWKPCGTGFECGRLDVPLDHHNASAGNASLAVGRYLATSKTRKSSLFVNPGGPGGSGLSFLYRAGPKLSEMLNGEYDIVSMT